MLDMKVLRNEPEKVKRAFLKRKEKASEIAWRKTRFAI